MSTLRPGWKAYQLGLQRLECRQLRAEALPWRAALAALLFVSALAFAGVVVNLMSPAP